jgi:EAL domain-containing protein (putative c-di-GMP-specific phosphodiesterase class I)
MQFATSSIKALREQGISIALDDFGTGYSSLSYLRLLPVDTLKIDKSFITRIGEDRVDALVVDGIIRLAHNLDLVVVAEGIETSQQNEILSNFGCDITQGYLTGRPMQFDIFQTWLADERGSLLI